MAFRSQGRTLRQFKCLPEPHGGAVTRESEQIAYFLVATSLVYMPPKEDSGLPTFRLSDLFVLPEDAIHLGDFMQDQEDTPHHGRAGWVVVLAVQIAAEFCNPQHHCAERGCLRWRFRGAVSA